MVVTLQGVGKNCHKDASFQSKAQPRKWTGQKWGTGHRQCLAPRVLRWLAWGAGHGHSLLSGWPRGMALPTLLGPLHPFLPGVTSGPQLQKEC